MVEPRCTEPFCRYKNQNRRYGCYWEEWPCRYTHQQARAMRVVCAWCGAVLSDGTEGRVSHGICEPCKIKTLNQQPKKD